MTAKRIAPPLQPLPWRLSIDSEDTYGGRQYRYCEGILDAKGDWVVRFDDDYGTNQWATARWIVELANSALILKRVPKNQPVESYPSRFLG